MADVSVKLFGPVKDIIGKDDLTLRIPVPASGDTAFEILAEQYPALRPWRSSVRLSVNLEYVSFDHPLHDGDELSIIPPVSGG